MENENIQLTQKQQEVIKDMFDSYHFTEIMQILGEMFRTYLCDEDRVKLYDRETLAADNYTASNVIDLIL